MTAEELQETLLNILEGVQAAREEGAEDDPDITVLADLAQDMAENFEGDITVRTYQREMMLTRDSGLVVRLAGGDEFQLTIVQSRRGRADDAE